MPTYSVELVYTERHVIEVTCDDEEDAVINAQVLIGFGSHDWEVEKTEVITVNGQPYSESREWAGF
jgi:hypothetical protein